MTDVKMSRENMKKNKKMIFLYVFTKAEYDYE